MIECELGRVLAMRTLNQGDRLGAEVDAFVRLIQERAGHSMAYASSDARRESLPHWMTHYDERRSHSALGNRSPLARVREVTGLNT